MSVADRTRWVIVAFLPSSHIDAAVRDFRARHDPLAEFIAPHITLVHPFVAPIGSDVLRDHIAQVTDGIGPFDVSLAEITPFPDGYIYLNVKKGNDSLVALRDRLYSGPLASYKSRRDTFVPHVTIGRASDDQHLERVLADAADLDLRADVEVTEITAYRFDEHDRRVVDFAVPLHRAVTKADSRHKPSGPVSGHRLR